MSEFLFIGGSLDGTVHKAVQATVHIPVVEPSDDPECIGCGHETYIKRSIEGSDRTFFVYLLTGVSMDDALLMLLKRYKKLDHVGG